LLKHLADMQATSSCNLALAGETKAAIARHQKARGGDSCMVLSLQSWPFDWLLSARLMLGRPSSNSYLYGRPDAQHSAIMVLVGVNTMYWLFF
jgi:hypothetical protein